MLYIVAFKPNACEDVPFAPDGEPVECDRETAEARYRELVRRGKDGETIAGLLPWCVYVTDIRASRVYVTEYTCKSHPDDPPLAPQGPWAQLN